MTPKPCSHCEPLETRMLLTGVSAAGLHCLVPTPPAGMPIPRLAATVPLTAQSAATTKIYWYYESPRSLPQQRTPGHMRVLFIGNSFTLAIGGQPGLVSALATAAKEKRTPTMAQICHPNWTLSQLYADPLPRSRIAEKAPGSTAPTWDYVVIQPHCLEPLSDYAAMMRGGLALDAAIRAAGAKTVIYEPWGREDYPSDETAMVAACHELARRIDADPANLALHRKSFIVPVGPAWDMARHRRSDINLYSPDRAHPSEAGGYLTACAFYSFLYGKSPEGLAPNITASGTAHTWHVKLPRDQAEFLQRIAYKLVKESGFAHA